LVYISGQLPVDPLTGEKITGSIENQTDQVLKNLSAILDASGSSLDRVLKATVPTRELHFGFGIEIEAVAALD
jgi:enamine deaminase RidA (YjgF/YER057c/UK114 family)